jgi:hypothetical protein
MMKHVLTVLLLACFTIGQTPSDSPRPIPIAQGIDQGNDQANTQKAQNILDQAIQALGGDAYMKIQDVSQEGRTYSFYHGRPNSDGLQFWRFSKYPDKERVELTKQRDVVEIVNGDKGYEVTYRGPRPQDEKNLKDYLKRRQYSLAWVLRGWLKEPGVALFYEDQTVAEGKTVDQVTVMNAKNQGVTLFIDSDTHLPLKKSFTWRDPNDKERNVEEETYANYRPAQGVMTPYTVTRYYNGDMSNQTFLTSATYNQNLSDSLFDASVPIQRKK